jgi:hypothetical protein
MTGRAITGSLMLLVAGCAAITDVRHPSRRNPTRWTYPRPFAEVVRCLESNELAVDAWGNRVHTSMFYEPVRNPSATLAYIEIVSEGHGSKAVHSETYLQDACPLGLYGEWQAAVLATSPSTTQVEVVPVRLSVHNHECFYIGHPWGCAIDVKPSTVEEYRLLTALGRCLDVEGMPSVVRPEIAADEEEPDPQSCD